LRHVRRDLAEADSVVLEAEDRGAASLEGAVQDGLHRQEDGDVWPLHGTGQDVLAEERLVLDRMEP
jgi:hypothetical protein